MKTSIESGRIKVSDAVSFLVKNIPDLEKFQARPAIYYAARTGQIFKRQEYLDRNSFERWAAQKWPIIRSKVKAENNGIIASGRIRVKMRIDFLNPKENHEHALIMLNSCQQKCKEKDEKIAKLRAAYERASASEAKSIAAKKPRITRCR